MSTESEHSVYVFYDEGGKPLYVGCTTDVARRTREHQRNAPAWWPRAYRVRTVYHGPLGQAIEQVVISLLRPEFNVVYNTEMSHHLTDALVELRLMEATTQEAFRERRRQDELARADYARWLGEFLTEQELFRAGQASPA